eukprot:SAG31_NODE_32481_length_355_cov_0.851562_1_plen_78_part_01
MGQERHADAGSRAEKPLVALRQHRDEVVTEMGDDLKEAQSSDDLTHITQLLSSSEIFENELHSQRKALERRRHTVVKA